VCKKEFFQTLQKNATMMRNIRLMRMRLLQEKDGNVDLRTFDKPRDVLAFF